MLKMPLILNMKRGRELIAGMDVGSIRAHATICPALIDL